MTLPTQQPTQQELTALKSLAEAATPGPWEATRQTDDECSFIGYFIEGKGRTISDDGTAPCAVDALFIAAWNPSTAIALLSLIDAQQKKIAEQDAQLQAAYP